MSRYPSSSTRFPRSESFAPSSTSYTGTRDENFASDSTFHNDPRAGFSGRAYHPRTEPDTGSFPTFTVPLAFDDDSRNHDGCRPHTECDRESYVTSYDQPPYQEFSSESSFQRESRAGFPSGVNRPRSMSFGPSSSSFTNPPVPFVRVFGDASIPGAAFPWAVNPACDSCSMTASRFETYYQNLRQGPPPPIWLEYLCKACLRNFGNFPNGPPLRAAHSTWQDTSNAFDSGRVGNAASFDSQPRTFIDSRGPAASFGPRWPEDGEGNLRKWSTEASKGSSQDPFSSSYPRAQPVSCGPPPTPSTSNFPSEAISEPGGLLQQAPGIYPNCNPHWLRSPTYLPYCGENPGRHKDYCSLCNNAFLNFRDDVLHQMTRDMQKLSLEDYLQKWLPDLARARPRFIGIGKGSHGWAMTAEEYMKKYFGDNEDETDDTTVFGSGLGCSAVDGNTTATSASSTTRGSQSGTEMETRSGGRSITSYNEYRRKYRHYSPTASEDRNRLSYDAYIAKWGDQASTTASSVAHSITTASVTGTERSRGSRSQKSSTSASRRSTITASRAGTESTRGRRRRRYGSPASTKRSGTTVSAAITELRRHSSSPQRYRSLSRSVSPLDSSVNPSRSRSVGTSSVASDDSALRSRRRRRLSGRYKSKLQSPSPSNSEESNDSDVSDNSEDSDKSDASDTSNKSINSGVSSRSRTSSPVGSINPEERTAKYRALHPRKSNCPLEYILSAPNEHLVYTHFGHHDRKTGEWIECPFWKRKKGMFVKHKRDVKGRGKEKRGHSYNILRVRQLGPGDWQGGLLRKHTLAEMKYPLNVAPGFGTS
ncbi:hypothetical protein BDZ45DRAFT_808645 [Acephala macrosclerotiorum]|nr:hypothetical protein BDZ45DRAFT_808645 [Acephala macrosclerotiorum]